MGHLRRLCIRRFIREFEIVGKRIEKDCIVEEIKCERERQRGWFLQLGTFMLRYCGCRGSGHNFPLTGHHNQILRCATNLGTLSNVTN